MYKNGTYVAFDGQGTTDPTKSDLKYLGLLRGWNKSKKYDLSFSDSHLKTYQVMDSSLMTTLKKRLLERFSNSKNMLLILSEDTNYNRGLLNWEIEKAVDVYHLPIIVAYTGYNSILAPEKLSDRWPKSLKERIDESKVAAIHIPFKEKAIMGAINQFSIHNSEKDALTHPLTTYTEETYKKWGYR